MYDNRKRNVDRGVIKIRENQNDRKRILHKDIQKDVEKNEFCYKMYNDWIRTNNPVDIPVLIMDNKNLVKNKDIDIIPRLYSKYAQKHINIPFLYSQKKNKYVTLNKYFRTYLNKDIPNSTEFKNFLIEKKDINKNQDLYESINIFLYTSFLLKQFSAVMKIVPHFYSPISDETKYYFYILFDYLRRDCIQKEIPLMKHTVIELIQNLSLLNNKVCTNELFLNTFTFLNESIFDDTNKFYLITLNKIFKFDLLQKTGETSTQEISTKEVSIKEESKDFNINILQNELNMCCIKNNNQTFFNNKFDLLRTP